MRDKRLWPVTAKRFLVALGAVVLMSSSCGSSGDDSSGSGGSAATPAETTTPPETSTPAETTTPAETSAPNTAPDEDATIVTYEVKTESGSDPHALDVTFTNNDGESETDIAVALPWQAGGFVAVGTDVSLNAKSGFVEVAPFSCTVRMNGRSFTEQSHAVTEGNDIVGAECVVGPIAAEAVLG
jgi:hypothetical protein